MEGNSLEQGSPENTSDKIDAGLFEQTKKDLNRLEKTITDQETETEVKKTPEQISNILAAEGISIPAEAQDQLPAMWHDITLLAGHVLKEGLKAFPNFTDYTALNTEKTQVAVFKSLLRQTASGLRIQHLVDPNHDLAAGNNLIEDMFAPKKQQLNDTEKSLSIIQEPDPTKYMDNIINAVKEHLDKKFDSAFSETNEKQKILTLQKETYKPTQEDVIAALTSGQSDNKLEITPNQDISYQKEVKLHMSGFLNTFTGLMSVVMPQAINNIKKQREESKSRSDFFAKGDQKDQTKSFINSIIGILLDFSGKFPFGNVKSSELITGALTNIGNKYLEAETKYCFKDFQRLQKQNPNTVDKQTLEMQENDIPEIPLFTIIPGEKKETINKTIHVDHFFETLKTRHSGYINFSPTWLATYATNNDISKDNTKRDVVYDTQKKARRVNPDATNQEKLVLTNAFLCYQIKKHTYRQKDPTTTHLITTATRLSFLSVYTIQKGVSRQI